MRHARDEDLDRIERLLGELRALGFLVEKKRGVFSRGSRAFLHFHEHESELFADVRLAEDFERFRVQTRQEQRALLATLRRFA